MFYWQVSANTLPCEGVSGGHIRRDLKHCESMRHARLNVLAVRRHPRPLLAQMAEGRIGAGHTSSHG